MDETKELLTKHRQREILAKINEELDRRGVVIDRIEEEEEVQIQLLNLSSAEVAENVKQVMVELDLPFDIKTTLKRWTVKFREDHGKGFYGEEYKDRLEDQKLSIYTIHPQKKDIENGGPVVVFVPGGSVRERNTLHSSYTSLLQAQAEAEGKPTFFYTMDYRGSSSDRENQSYCMLDRDTDALILSKVAIENHKTHFNSGNEAGSLTLVGNSMGGDVVANISSIVLPNNVVLLQAAAYSKEARNKHFRGPGDRYDPINNPFGDAIRKEGMWRTATSYENLERYMRAGGHALIVGAVDDETVTSEMSRNYMQMVTYYYVENAVKAAGASSYTVGYLWIPTSHIETTSEEVKHVNKVLNG